MVLADAWASVVDFRVFPVDGLRVFEGSHPAEHLFLELDCLHALDRAGCHGRLAGVDALALKWLPEAAWGLQSHRGIAQA